MATQDELSKRFGALLALGIAVMQTQRQGDEYLVLAARFTMVTDRKLFHQWRSASVSALLQVFGQPHPYTQSFDRAVDTPELRDVEAGMGILEAAKAEIDGGWLTELTTLVAGEVFTDFLDMAEHLLQNGYFHPAASLIGAVLEDGMRRIARNHEIELALKETSGSLNLKLRRKPVYNQVVARQVDVWADIRNYADHGRFQEFTERQVKEMLAGVRNYLAQYLH
ncbi:MAG TPA: hypothetical protein VFB73_00010 [Chloroflexota bacterium]|nr:hypothetical protein [Chloroflexota bacterium]